MLVGVLAAAQNTPQTAFDVIEGENHYDFPSETMEPKTAYWQVTAPSDCGRLTNLFIKSRGCSFTITDQDGTVITPVTFSLSNGSGVYFDQPAGSTAIIEIHSGSFEPNTIVFDAAIMPYHQSGNNGRDRDNPLDFNLDSTLIFYPGGDYEMVYSCFTAPQEGMLTLLSPIDFNGAAIGTVNGEYTISLRFAWDTKLMMYKAQTPVNAGVKYYMFFAGTGDYIVQSSFSVIKDGDNWQRPLTAQLGYNSVPQAKGVYWYKFTNTATDGFYRFVGDPATDRGTLGVACNESELMYNYFNRQSATDCYDLRVMVQLHYSDIYICVNKTEDTPTEGSFTITYEPLKQGDTREDPIPLEGLGAVTLPQEFGYVCYAVTIPANVHAMLSATASPADMTNTRTYVGIGPLKTYAQAYGRNFTACEVNTTQPTTYVIEIDKYERIAYPITLALMEIGAGDTPDHRITAVEGFNPFTGQGHRYYRFLCPDAKRVVITPSSSAITLESNCSFTAVDGSWTFAADENTEILLDFSNVPADASFTLSVADYAPGEHPSSAIALSDGEFTINPEPSTTWYTFSSPREGMLDIYSDFSDPRGTIAFASVPDEDYLQGISHFDPASGRNVWEYTAEYHANTVLYLMVRTTQANPDCMVFISARDSRPGERADNPLPIVADTSIELPAVLANVSTWLSIPTAQAGEIHITSPQYFGAYLFDCYESYLAETPSAGSLFNDDHSTYIDCTVSAAEAGQTYLLMISYAPESFTITVSGSALPSASNIDIQADEAAPIYYNLQGIRITEPLPGMPYLEQRSNHTTLRLR